MNMLRLIAGIIIMSVVQTLCAQETPQTPDEAAMMQEWLETTTPGVEHEWMKSHTGAYDYVNESWMEPGKPSTKSTGMSQELMIMGDRYQLSQIYGESYGMPFEGQSIMAYDKITKEYITTWIDNMGTGIMVFRGSRIGDTIDMFTDYHNPMTQVVERHRMLLDYSTSGRYVMTYYVTEPGKDERKVMRIDYTKKV